MSTKKHGEDLPPPWPLARWEEDIAFRYELARSADAELRRCPRDKFSELASRIKGMSKLPPWPKRSEGWKMETRIRIPAMRILRPTFTINLDHWATPLPVESQMPPAENGWSDRFAISHNLLRPDSEHVAALLKCLSDQRKKHGVETPPQHSGKRHNFKPWKMLHNLNTRKDASLTLQALRQAKEYLPLTIVTALKRPERQTKRRTKRRTKLRK